MSLSCLESILYCNEGHNNVTTDGTQCAAHSKIKQITAKVLLMHITVYSFTRAQVWSSEWFTSLLITRSHVGFLNWFGKCFFLLRPALGEELSLLKEWVLGVFLWESRASIKADGLSTSQWWGLQMWGTKIMHILKACKCHQTLSFSYSSTHDLFYNPESFFSLILI